MSPPNIAKHCVIPSCPCGRAGAAAACDNVHLYSTTMCCVFLSNDILMHQLVMRAYCLRHVSLLLPSLTLQIKSCLVCRDAMKAHSRRARAACSAGDKTKHMERIATQNQFNSIQCIYDVS